MLIMIIHNAALYQLRVWFLVWSYSVPVHQFIASSGPVSDLPELSSLSHDMMSGQRGKKEV